MEKRKKRCQHILCEISVFIGARAWNCTFLKKFKASLLNKEIWQL